MDINLLKVLMCRKSLNQAMANLGFVLLTILLFITTVTDAGKKEKVDKIVIHVPYKIHKHHHVHTKYKVITLPPPKKESTIIYYKPMEHQPNIKIVHLPQYPPLHMELKDQNHQIFISPHQASAQAIVQSIHKPPEIKKPVDQHESSIMHTPVIAIPHENFAPLMTYKPIIYHNPEIYLPKPIFQHSNEMVHFKMPYTPKFPTNMNSPKIPFKPLPPSNTKSQDNIAHASNQFFTATRSPKTMKTSSYAVREPSQEDPPSSQPQRQTKGMKQVPFKGNLYTQQKTQSFRGNAIGPDSEYEHVGYLIIDGQNRKVVDKNFQEKSVLLKR